MDEPAIRTPDGAPTDANPSLTIADFGPAPIGVPNFVIDQFTIPPFLLPIYQACGTQYGIPWQVLASINRIETAFGTNLNVSSAGALGWMQFMPATWRTYGVDANSDGREDPYNPVDAICAAARYLRASGGQEDLAGAIFAYNHADWYVDEVLLYARQYGRLPDDLVGSLTGLTEGARFPVAANARYADDISERRALKRSRPGKRAYGNAAEVISSSPTRRGIDIYSREGAPVVAVNDGVITEIGKSKELGRFIVLRDAYGNRFTYAKLGEGLRRLPGAEAAAPLGRRLRAGLPERPEAEAGSERGQQRRGATRPRRPQGAAGRRTDQHRGHPRAPLRVPRAGEQRRPRRSHGPARLVDEGPVPRLRVVQVVLLRRASVRLQDDGDAAAEGGLARDRRDRARQDRQGRRGRAAGPLRDPPRRPRRAEDRPEADPRRLEAARGHRDLPRRRREPARRRRHHRPGAADVEAAADQARARRSAARDLCLRARGHPGAVRSTAACWRCSSTSSSAASA